jgi:hypothetical protein
MHNGLFCQCLLDKYADGAEGNPKSIEGLSGSVYRAGLPDDIFSNQKS